MLFAILCRLLFFLPIVATGPRVVGAGALPADSTTSVALVSVAGVPLCHAAPGPDGMWTAKHCLWKSPATLAVGGRAAVWSRDPVRDLAHIAAFADREQVVRSPVMGETLTYNNERGAGAVTAWGIVNGLYEVEDRIPADYLVACHTSGRQIWGGDSGTGVYGADGALIGVITNALPIGVGDHRCGGRQAIDIATVP